MIRDGRGAWALIFGGLGLMAAGPAVGGLLGGGPVTVPATAAIMAAWALLGRPNARQDAEGVGPETRPLLGSLVGALSAAALFYGLGAAAGALGLAGVPIGRQQAVLVGAGLTAAGAGLCHIGARGRRDPIDAIFAWLADRLGG